MESKNPVTLTARVIVTNKNNEVLVIRRSETNSRSGYFELPGGLVEEGENLEAAAMRELYEETGIKASNIKLVQTSSYSINGEARLSGIFNTKIEDSGIKLSNEHDKYEWINANNFNNIQMEDFYVKFFNDYFLTDETKKMNKVKSTENTTVKHILVYTDGGSRGNPGPSASGYVIMNEEEAILEEGGEYLGITTNNQAEYQAVKLGLENAKKYNPSEVSFYIDSLLVVNQMTGKFKIKSKELWPIHEDIKRLATQFEKVTFTHVKREFNTLADEQVNIVLDSYEHRNGSK